MAANSAVPTRGLAVVACMDARLDVYRILGLKPGEAHVIRVAGGVVTDDVMASLVLSQRKLATTKIVLIHHTDCGVCGFDVDTFNKHLESETGQIPDLAFATFDDPAESVRTSIEALRANPFLRHRDDIVGYVYDVEFGQLNEVK